MNRLSKVFLVVILSVTLTGCLSMEKETTLKQGGKIYSKSVFEFNINESHFLTADEVKTGIETFCDINKERLNSIDKIVNKRISCERGTNNTFITTLTGAMTNDYFSDKNGKYTLIIDYRDLDINPAGFAELPFGKDFSYYKTAKNMINVQAKETFIFPSPILTAETGVIKGNRLVLTLDDYMKMEELYKSKGQSKFKITAGHSYRKIAKGNASYLNRFQRKSNKVSWIQPWRYEKSSTAMKNSRRLELQQKLRHRRQQKAYRLEQNREFIPKKIEIQGVLDRSRALWDIKDYALIDGVIYKYSFNDARKVIGADIDTFEVLGDQGLFAKDKNNVYKDWKIIERADPVTFKIIDSVYSRDKNYIFAHTSPVEYIDVNTFEIIKGDYQKDRYNIYWQTKPLEGADLNSFRVIGFAMYAKDKNYVYWNGRLIPKADPASFQIFEGGSFAKDHDTVFRYGKPLYDIDAESFEYIDESCAKDKNGDYCWK